MSLFSVTELLVDFSLTSALIVTAPKEAEQCISGLRTILWLTIQINEILSKLCNLPVFFQI